MIALEINGAGGKEVCVNRTASHADDGSILNNRSSVENYREMTLVERNADVLPFARLLFNGNLGSDATVVCGHIVGVNFLAEAIYDLNFKTAAEIDAGVCLRRDAHIVFKVEIVEISALRLDVHAAYLNLPLAIAGELVGKNLLATFFGPALGVSLSLLALQYTQAGIAQTIMSLVPVLIILPSRLVFKTKVTAMEVVGAVIAVIGASLFFV